MRSKSMGREGYWKSSLPPSLPPGQTEITYLTLSHERCDPSQKMEEQNTQRPPVYRVVVSCVHYSLSIQIKMQTHGDNFYEKYSILNEHIPIQQKWRRQFDVFLAVESNKNLWARVEVISPDGASEQQRVPHTPEYEGRFRCVVRRVLHSVPAQTPLQPYGARLIAGRVLELAIELWTRQGEAKIKVEGDRQGK